MKIDFRSDTVTKPTPAMLQAMSIANVGDDVFGEDPSINQLENLSASMFGMEAALFCPSGTMTNQIAIKCHTQPGDEVICERLSHIYQYEAGGIAFNSGCSVALIDGNRGLLTSNDVVEAINKPDIHKAISSLVCLENTSNRGGGSMYDFNEILAIKKVCNQHNLQLHLDGARLMNAIVASGQTALDYGNTFDSISLCLSKGLGAPVGSVLIGSKQMITKARRIRKIFGGGMRQAGYLAAAGIYALENNVDRLAIDHLHAQQIGASLHQHSFVGEILPIDTNILIFEVKEGLSPYDFLTYMQQHDIHVYAISKTQVRIVTHLDITKEMVDKTIEVINAM
jgi:threonine aldolase